MQDKDIHDVLITKAQQLKKADLTEEEKHQLVANFDASPKKFLVEKVNYSLEKTLDLGAGSTSISGVFDDISSILQGLSREQGGKED